jgi:hypothetical protein
MFFNEEKGVFFWRLPQLHISIVLESVSGSWESGEELES